MGIICLSHLQCHTSLSIELERDFRRSEKVIRVNSWIELVSITPKVTQYYTSSVSFREMSRELPEFLC